jgi:hypothetical protein
MTFALARVETRGPRIRLYCEMLPSLLIGAPSKNHNGRRRVPVLPELVGRGEEVTRLLESRVEILIEEIDRLHDVHVAIDEPIAFFHIFLLFVLVSGSAHNAGSPSRTARTEI